MKKIAFLFILGALLSNNLVYAQTKSPQQAAFEELSKQAEEFNKLEERCDTSALIDAEKTGNRDEKKITEAAKHCRQEANQTVCNYLFDGHPACWK